MEQQYYLTNGGMINVVTPNKCPRCHGGIFPEELFADARKNDNHTSIAYVVFQCPICKQFFSTEYLINVQGDFLMIIDSYPFSHEDEKFSKEIERLSPKFCQIYNESLHAEHTQLNEIVGMGYRKALEFLIKDFATKRNPDNKKEISECWLNKCIKEYIDDERIQKLAEKTSWLGNDESHFLRQYDDKNTIQNMKLFIKAIVNFIESYMAIEEAEKIKKK